MSSFATQITLFGALEIAHGRMPTQRPPTQRVLTLLGYLIVHHDVPQARDKLVDLLWPDLPPSQGRRMLSDALWRARRLLEPADGIASSAIVKSGNAVLFQLSSTTWIDVLAFERDLTAPPDATLERVRGAVALYRGEFLEACYDDWALYERERLRELYLGALQRLRAFDQARGAYDAALQSALRLVRADPLREDGHRALMRLYYLLDRTDDALRAFEQCRAALRDELGVEPEPETLSLYDEIAAMKLRRTGNPAQPQSVQPTSASTFEIDGDLPFVGRQAVRAELMEAVEAALAGSGGLILLAGPAGLGKSRLLRELATGALWRGAAVSWGHARQDPQARPLEALRPALLQALSPLRARLLADLLPPHTLATLLPLLPELIDRLPEHALRLPAAAQPPAALHAALGAVLLALAQHQPQLHNLEDLH
jgi:DNA-binding SARP family transcriptional activator